MIDDHATDDELLALAKKATPGPWEATDGVVWIDTREQVCCGRSYTECCGQYDIKGGQEKIADSGETDAAYIAAANPAAIIAMHERHRAEVEQLTRERDALWLFKQNMRLRNNPQHDAQVAIERAEAAESALAAAQPIIDAARAVDADMTFPEVLPEGACCGRRFAERLRAALAGPKESDNAKG